MRMQVFLTINRSSFVGEVRQRFKEAVARASGLHANNVSIIRVEAGNLTDSGFLGTRRLLASGALGISVHFTIFAESGTEAANAAFELQNNLQTELVAEGQPTCGS